ncbi:MAG: NAD-dependent epimerase/dehydratase family protein [Pseudomonadales bacterium]|nr:NAD-dependent epimerase/dehydratase family protein [Pseudomonadales bacterium]
MKIFITGATGFVGAHTTLALLKSGHDCHLLVRNLDAAQTYFHKHCLARGLKKPSYIVGDMLDTVKVKAAMADCDAVVHTAALVDLDPRNAEKTLQTNLQGIASILGTACELGIKKILYVSSVSAIMHTEFKVVDETAPLISSKDAYTRSKTECEKKVRAYQEEGYPIVITYPAGVIGPDDPKLSETNSAIMELLVVMVPKTSAGIPLVDVRDLAKMQVELLEADVFNDKALGRYIIGGFLVPWQQLAMMLEKACGRKLLCIPLPGVVFRFLGVLFDVARLFRHIELPISRESTRIATQAPEFSSAKLLSVVNSSFRPTMDTVEATCQWLETSGLIEARRNR